MKTLFTSTFFCLAVTAFAQDTKKQADSEIDYGARIYDPSIGRHYMPVDPNAPKINPFDLEKMRTADTTKAKQACR